MYILNSWTFCYPRYAFCRLSNKPETGIRACSLPPSLPVPQPNAPVVTARSIQNADPCLLANSRPRVAATTPGAVWVPSPGENIEKRDYRTCTPCYNVKCRQGADPCPSCIASVGCNQPRFCFNTQVKIYLPLEFNC